MADQKSTESTASETTPSTGTIAPTDSLVVLPKKYHIFISYRVATDASLAEKLCDKLQQHDVGREHGLRVRCFLDKQCLKAGMEWEDSFRQGLQESCVFLPIVSEGALKPLLEANYNGKQDNVLLEYENALGMRSQGGIQIFPLLVGTVSNGAYRKFSGFCGPYSAKNSPTANIPVKDTLGQLFSLQGQFTNPDEIGDKISSIVKFLSDDAWPLYRSFWAFRDELGPEVAYTCVQCGCEYKESENGRGHCTFHPYGYGWHGYYCCKDRNKAAKGCQRARHRSKHHNDYRYQARINWMTSMLNYVDKHKEFCNCESDNYEGDSITAKVGVLTGSLNTYGSLYLQMDFEWFTVYSKEELEIIEHGLISGASPVIHTIHDQEDKTSKGGGGERVAEASWMLEDRKLVGIKLCCRTPTSFDDDVREVRFRWRDVSLVELESVKVVSRGGVMEKKSQHRRSLQNQVLVRGGKSLMEPKPGSGKADIWFGGSLSKQLLLKSAAKNPILPNQRSRPGADLWTWEFTAVNLSAAPIVLLDCHVQVGPVGQALEDATDVVARVSGGSSGPSRGGGNQLGGKELPVTVPPHETVPLSVAFVTKEPTKNRNVFDVAWGARENTLALKLSVKDARGLQSSLLSEHRNVRGILYRKPSSSNAFFWMYIDNPESFEREYIHVARKGKKPQQGIEIYVRKLGRSWTFDAKALRKITYQALKEKKDMIPHDTDCDWLKVEFAIDHQLQSVYAVYIHAKTDHGEAAGVCLIPEYAEDNAETGEAETKFDLKAMTKDHSDWEEQCSDPAFELPWAESEKLDINAYKDAEEAQEAAPAAAVGGGGGFTEDDRKLLKQVNGKLDLLLSRLQAIELKVATL